MVNLSLRNEGWERRSKRCIPGVSCISSHWHGKKPSWQCCLHAVSGMCSFREGHKLKAGLKADILEIHPLCLLSANACHLRAVRGRGKKKAIFMRAVNSRQAGWAWINLFSHSCLDKVSCHWKHNRNSQLLFQEAEMAVPWAFWSTAVAAGLAGLSCALMLHWPCLVTSSALFKAKCVFLLNPKWRTGADAYHPVSCDQMQIGAFYSCDQQI